jgi:cardiolipin synthase A/B
MRSGRKRKQAIYSRQNKVQLVRGGKPYFDCLMQMIANAKDSIHLQTYIYMDDETGRQVADALKAAVNRKVTVHLLVDGYASKSLSRQFIEEVKKAGIQFRFFEPIFKNRNFYFGRRLHHKIVVVDSRYSLTGGVNITDRYNDMPDIPAWLDFALFTEGEVARELCKLCWQTWHGFPPRLNLTACEQQQAPWSFDQSETAEVAMRRNDWVRRRNEISGTYIEMFRSAKSHITILCSYFLPGRIIRRQMALAAKKGVSIRVITAGTSDVRTAKYAERYLYGWLLRNKIDLYEYQPRVLHGKIAVCDGQWMTTGSYNINDISAYASIELNLNVKDPKLAGETEKMLEEIMNKDCIHITTDEYARTHNLFKKLIEWLSYQFVRALLYLFTFYFKRKH